MIIPYWKSWFTTLFIYYCLRGKGDWWEQQWEFAACVRLPSTENCLQTGCVCAVRGTVTLSQPNASIFCAQQSWLREGPAERGNELIEFQFVKSSFSHCLSNLTQVPLPEIKRDSCFNFTRAFISLAFFFLCHCAKACKDFSRCTSIPLSLF